MDNKCKHIVKTDTLTLSDCHNGFFLYDKTRGMNLAMRAKTEQEAFIKTIEYYQKRLVKVESALSSATHHIDEFISHFRED